MIACDNCDGDDTDADNDDDVDDEDGDDQDDDDDVDDEDDNIQDEDDIREIIRFQLCNQKFHSEEDSSECLMWDDNDHHHIKHLKKGKNKNDGV